MSNSVQEFFSTATLQAATDLEKALLRLPEEKRNWSPAEKARTAMDQVAECAILNGSTSELIKTRTWNADYDFPEFLRKKEELARDWGAAKSLLNENTGKVIAAIGKVPDEDLGIVVDMPWGPMTLAQIVAYPYWNMSYHEGQINYIASILGCLQ